MKTEEFAIEGFGCDSEFVGSVLPAVNYGERRGSIDILLYHYTGMEDSDAALDWLRCEESGVSCHYFIYEDGRIIQLLPESVRAHHAGESFWLGERDINSHSIGIELANAGHSVSVLPEFPIPQMESLSRLSRDIITRHAIRPERVLGHSDVSPFRKRDPGELFDWGWLHSEGIGHYVSPVISSDFSSHSDSISDSNSNSDLSIGSSGSSVRGLQASLLEYGYDCAVDGIFGDRTRIIVEAFQRHFCSRVTGIADIETLRILDNLLSSLTSSPPPPPSSSS